MSNFATLEKLKKELEPYKGTLVLDYFKVVRLVGVSEDEDDFYWIFDTKKGIVNSSCLVGWIPLKGFIDDEEYINLVKVWNYNNTEEAI